MTAVAGSAEAGAVVTLFDGGTEIGSTVATGTGTWSLPFALAPGVHGLNATATDPAGNVSAASSVVTARIGTAGDDVLTGAPGVDLFAGGFGNDTYTVDDPTDVVVEANGQGNDTILASVGYTLVDASRIEFLQAAPGASGLALTGNKFANTITGGDGDDTIAGGGGADKLFGGKGADTFALLALSDSSVAAKGRDTIMDFSTLEGDLIDLAALDADTGLAGNQAFTFIGNAAFTAAGQVRAEVVGGATIVSGNVNAALGADFAIRLTGSHALNGSHFIL
jgi:Ca2+-binding RTX toxin-like protein